MVESLESLEDCDASIDSKLDCARNVAIAVHMRKNKERINAGLGSVSCRVPLSRNCCFFVSVLAVVIWIVLVLSVMQRCYYILSRFVVQ